MSNLICEGEGNFTPDEFSTKNLALGLNKAVESRLQRYMRLMAENGVYGAHGRSVGKSFQIAPGQRGSCKIDKTQVWIDEANIVVPAVSVGIGQVSFKQSVLTTAVKAAMKKV